MRRTRILLDAEFNPLKLNNPLGFEAFTSLYLLATLQQYIGAMFYVLPAIGL